MIDYSKDEWQLVSYKHPKQRKLHYVVIHVNDKASNERVINNKAMQLYGVHAVGTYQEVSNLIKQ